MGETYIKNKYLQSQQQECRKNIGWVNFYSNVFFLSWVLNFEHSPIKFSKPGATFLLLPVKTHLTWWRQQGSGGALLLCPAQEAGSIPVLRPLKPAASQQDSCENADQATNICSSWEAWPFPRGEGCSTSPLWKATRSLKWKCTEELRAPQQPCSKCLLFKAQSC